jgi:hypothetical protein
MTGRTGQGDRTRPVTIGQTVTARVRERERERAVAVIGPASPYDWTRYTRRPIGVQRAPRAIGRVRSHVTRRAARPISSTLRSTPLGARPDAPVPGTLGHAGHAPFLCVQVN